MNRGLGFLIIGIFAILGGAAFAALLIKSKLTRERNIDFDDYDSIVDDDEFEHFFGDEEADDDIVDDIAEDSADEKDRL